MIKTVKIWFVDFWDNFNPEDNFIINLLKKNFTIELSDKPDFLFYSVFGSEHQRYDCVRIFYTGENQAPDFNIADYAIGYDRIEFGDRYYRYPFYYLYKDDYSEMMSRKTDFTADDLRNKTGFCSFVYSNNNASPERGIMFDILNRYKKVSSGGKYLNNVGGPVKDKLAFESTHKFSIAFENCSHSGYTTEKLVQAFAAKTVPIYWGDPSVCEIFNRDAFINVMDYPSMEDAAEAVKVIDNNDELYLKMLKAPALVNPQLDNKATAEENLGKYLCGILDQNPADAQRCSRIYWGKRYLDNARMREKAYRHTPRGVAEHLYKKYFWRHRAKSKLFWAIDRMFKKQ